MREQVCVEVDQDIYQRLRALAEPWHETPGRAIRRVLDEWERLKRAGEPGTAISAAGQTTERTSPRAPEGFFETSRGVRIPFGELRASYRPRGKPRVFLKAAVTQRGIEAYGEVFDDPSPAGMHAKQQFGASPSASITNGWKFWEYQDQLTGTWTSLAGLRGS